MDLRERVESLPNGPGVYLFESERGKVLYVGKAQNLRSRVRSYLLPGGDGRAQIPKLVERIADVKVLVTPTVKDALLLENELIKRHRPRFNVRLRDDKRYLCLRLDHSHEYPRMTLVRRFKNDGATYFGPYTDAKSLRNTLKALREIYPLRTCSDRTLDTIAAPCLYYQLGRCAPPCHDLISKDDYAALVDETVDLLRGNLAVDLLRGKIGRAVQQECRDRYTLSYAVFCLKKGRGCVPRAID